MSILAFAIRADVRLLTYTDLSPVILKKAVVNEHFCQQIVKDRFKWYFYADDKFRRTHAFEHKEKL